MRTRTSLLIIYKTLPNRYLELLNVPINIWHIVCVRCYGHGIWATPPRGTRSQLFSYQPYPGVCVSTLCHLVIMAAETTRHNDSADLQNFSV